MKIIPTICLALLCCGLLAPIAHGANTRFCFGEPATITDGAAGTTIVGTAGRDVIEAGAGRDVIFGMGGDDLICASDGDDDVYGGAGDDKISSGRGSGDVVEGGPGSDYMEGDHSCCYGLLGGDTVTFRNAKGPVTVDLPANKATGQGRDTVVGFGQVDGSDFDDTLIAEYVWPAPVIRGFSGNDLIVGYDGITDERETLIGGKGNDIIRGLDGVEDMRGGVGDDTIDGGLDASPYPYDEYWRGDVVSYGGGSLMTNGGTIELHESRAVTVDLVAGTATGEGDDTLIDIEDVYGTSHDDTLLENARDNVLGAGRGTDTINGRRGTDRCSGGETVRRCEYVFG